MIEKMEIVRKRVPFIVIFNMKWIKHYITSRFPKLGFVKELHEGCEFNEKLTMN